MLQILLIYAMIKAHFILVAVIHWMMNFLNVNMCQMFWVSDSLFVGQMKLHKVNWCDDCIERNFYIDALSFLFGTFIASL